MKGREREASIAASRLRAETSPKPSRPASCSSLELVDVGDVGDQAFLQEAQRLLLAEAVDVHRALADEVLDVLEGLAGAAGPVGADREDRVLGLDRRRAAGRAFGRRLRLRPRRLPFSWRWISGATTCGITSPARITTTSSPTRTSLRARSSSLCRVAVETVTPPTWTGSSIAKGTRWPVRPTFQTTSFSFVVAVVGANFQAIAQRGSRPTTPELAPERPLVDLDDDAVDLVVELVAALLPPAAALDHRLDALVVVDVGVDLEAALAQPLELLAVGGEVEAVASRRSRSTRSRAAVRRRASGSSWRIEPAAELRGLAKAGSPASARRSLSALKSAIGR